MRNTTVDDEYNDTVEKFASKKEPLYACNLAESSRRTGKIVVK